MPFLQAGFNGENTRTGIRGWTRHVRGNRFAPAGLHRFDCGDYFWLGNKPDRFVAWGECVVLGSHYGFDLPWEFQHGLGRCDLDTREEHAAVKWIPRPEGL